MLGSEVCWIVAPLCSSPAQEFISKLLRENDFNEIKSALMSQIRSYCQGMNRCLGKKINDKCYKWNSQKFPNVFEFLDSFPVLEFQMDNNFTYVWGPRDYFYSDNQEDYCLGLDEYR